MISTTGRLAPLGWTLLVMATAAPMLLVSLPPLVDVPGHLGQYAIQLAPPGSPLHRYFDFHWAVRLNLGVDVLMELLAPALGLQRAVWLACAAIPLLTAAAAVLLARHANPGVAAGTGWAMCFAYSYPFSYGFLNYCLGMALALLAFAAWAALEPRPRLREALFWPIVPALLLCHAIGGGLLAIAMVAAEAGAWQAARAPGEPLLPGLLPAARRLRPLLAAAPVVLLWRLGRHDEGLVTRYNLPSKLHGILYALRDQSRPLDLLSVAAVVAVIVAGRLAGARYGPRQRAVVLAFGLLYLAIPSELTGAWFADVRLVPALAILALTLLDWSGAPARLARGVAWLGIGLLVVRLGVTAHGYAAYERAYAAERAALPHVRPGSRVLALVTRRCRASRSWRMERLDHLPALATAERDAWVNLHWDIGDLHLLRIRYRPSPDFYDDPSQYVWPADCIHADDAEPIVTEEDRRNRRRTIEDVMPELPLAGVDYLWLVQSRLPAGPWTRELRPVWSNGASSLYRRVPTPAPAPARGLT